MDGPQRFVEWMSAHEHKDKLLGYVYRYHGRSDAHSKALCKFIIDDLLKHCQALREQAEQHLVVWETNVRFTFLQTAKKKTLDLAVGPPAAASIGASVAAILEDVFFACEAKTVMTEHVKCLPRIFDELNSSHEIVHQGNPKTIAAGITVVNIAEAFVSPLRQRQGQIDLVASRHRQPEVTQRVVTHLRGLAIRERMGQAGFDAYSTIVIKCDNQGPATLWTASPSPQPGDKDHYETFITRIARFYTERFS